MTDKPPSTSLLRFWQRIWPNLRQGEWRELWWALIDGWESHPTLRRWSYRVGALLLFLGIAAFWLLPWWQQRNAVKGAQAWLAANKLAQAAPAIQRLMTDYPERPATWQLAGQWAQQAGRPVEASDFLRQAADLTPEQPELTLDWAAQALAAGLHDDVRHALENLPPSFREHSGRANRIAGELARRQGQAQQAVADFEASIRLEGAQAFNEIPLGTVLLQLPDPGLQQQGQKLLAQWAKDPGEGGMMALRTLVQDGLAHRNRAQLQQWTRPLRQHPRCTLGDIPLVLGGLALAEPASFELTLAEMMRSAKTNTGLAAQMVGWLNQVGQANRGRVFAEELPLETRQRAPLAVVYAESLRLSQDWTALQALTAGPEWGADTDFLRWAYGLSAARQINDQAAMARYRQTLLAHARQDGAHALFAADTLYVWGMKTDALDLLWLAASEDSQMRWQALGTLARHYQVEHDANGQYRVFQQLHGLRPQDEAITNNYAYFASLMGAEGSRPLLLARALYEKSPENPTWRATYAFILTRQGSTQEALQLLEADPRGLNQSRPLRFAYAVALIGAGRTTEAAPYVQSVEVGQLCEEEATLLRSALP